LDYAPNGQWVASSGEGGAIFVTDSTSGERLYTLPAQANVLQFSPDSTRLASGGEDGLVRIWDFAEGEQFAEFDHQAPITSLAFRADGAWVAVGILDERLAIWEISSGDLVYEWVVE
jgi:WD40 repeat protein